MRAYLRYLGVEFIEGNGYLCGYLCGQLDIGGGIEEKRDHEMPDMGEMYEVVLVVEIDVAQLRIGLGLTRSGCTFSKLLCVWFSALISRAVVCTNFSFYFWGTLWQISTPSLSDSITPRTQANYYITRFRN